MSLSLMYLNPCVKLCNISGSVQSILCYKSFNRKYIKLIDLKKKDVYTYICKVKDVLLVRPVV